MWAIVLDDEPLMRNLLTRYLSLLGHDVTALATVAQAREHLRRDEREVSVFITDLNLGDDAPGGVPALLDEVRARSPACARIVVSGVHDTSDVEERCEAFLRKPFALDELQRALEALTS